MHIYIGNLYNYNFSQSIQKLLSMDKNMNKTAEYACQTAEYAYQTAEYS